MLPPEAQSLLGVASLVLIAIGLIVWAAGVKVAPVLVALATGLVGAALAAWLLPAVVGIAVVTAGLIGFVIGAMLGAFSFRVLQGVTLAACLGLAVAGGYYRMHVEHAPRPAPAIVETAAAEVKASDLLVRGRLGETGPAQTVAANQMAVFGRKLHERWNEIPSTDRTRMMVAAFGTAAVALLLAFGFAKYTTWVVSAVLGTLMLAVGIDAAVHLYAPRLLNYFPGAVVWRYAVLAILAGVGMLVQRWCFWGGERKARQGAPAEPVKTA
jgi:hypothetical protein